MLLVGRAPQKPVEHDQLDLTLSIGGKVVPTRIEEFHSALGVQIRKNRSQELEHLDCLLRQKNTNNNQVSLWF